MRYINEVAIDLKIQDLVDEKGLSRQCLYQLRDKQTGLENLRNLEKYILNSTTLGKDQANCNGCS